MSIFVNGAQLLILLFIVTCIALLSAVSLALSIQDEDAVFAWIWAVAFASSSLFAAWILWRLV